MILNYFCLLFALVVFINCEDGIVDDDQVDDEGLPAIPEIKEEDSEKIQKVFLENMNPELREKVVNMMDNYKSGEDDEELMKQLTSAEREEMIAALGKAMDPLITPMIKMAEEKSKKAAEEKETLQNENETSQVKNDEL